MIYIIVHNSRSFSEEILEPFLFQHIEDEYFYVTRVILFCQAIARLKRLLYSLFHYFT